jgi:FKBP-type peptidyl-prolyl cis-trans isomerase SlyD
MSIANDNVVTFHYRLYNEQGDEIETTRDGEPTLFLVGANNVLPGMEQAMLGKQQGDCFKITLESHMAYGMRKDNYQDRVPAKYLKHEGKLKPGQEVRIQTDDGTRSVTVIKVGKFSVDVDLNHPLAGQALTFDIEIIDVRDGSTEEITHGHAHGLGGHQH